MAENEQAKQPEQPPLQRVRSEEFENLYANNVLFESTLWDLRLYFGNVDLAEHQIVQHTAINVPWPQVKIMAYFLVVNLVIQQSLNGNVYIPNNIVPSIPDPSDPNFSVYEKQTVEYMKWIHEQFFGPNPYIPPAVAEADNV